MKALLVAWFDKLAAIFTLVEEEGVWPDGLLDAYIAMIPKADGDSTPLGQRPLCVLPITERLWASARLGHLEEWFRSWVPGSVFSAGGGHSSVEAWYSTALDIEGSLSGVLDSDVHILSLMLSSPLILLTVVFWIISSVGWGCRGGLDMLILNIMLRLALGLSSLVGLVSAGLEMEVSRRGALFSMIFIVALYLPWCRHLESFRGVKPQQNPDNLKCTSSDDADLLEAARLTNT